MHLTWGCYPLPCSWRLQCCCRIYDDEHASGNTYTYTYTGRRWDRESDLYYYRARHYNLQIEWAAKLKMKTDGLRICALEGDKPAVR